MDSCNYCDFEYEESSEYLAHLNKCHYRCCGCSQVFDISDDNELALCEKCQAARGYVTLEDQNDD